MHTTKTLLLLNMFIVMMGCQPMVILASPHRLEEQLNEPTKKTPKKQKSESKVQELKADLSDESVLRQALVKRAQSLLSRRVPTAKGKVFRADCSGFIEAVSYGAGIDIKRGIELASFKGSGVDLIRTYLKNSGDLELETPRVGDLIFFSDTYDKNRDGKVNDPLTHIGVIKTIEEDGTIHYIHHSNGKVRLGVANLFAPDIYKDEDDKVLNSYLRRRRARDRQSTAYMSGNLAVGFGSFFTSQKIAKEEMKSHAPEFIGPAPLPDSENPLRN